MLESWKAEEGKKASKLFSFIAFSYELSTGT